MTTVLTCRKPKAVFRGHLSAVKSTRQCSTDRLQFLEPDSYYDHCVGTVLVENLLLVDMIPFGAVMPACTTWRGVSAIL